MYYQICQKLDASAARRIVNLNSKFFVDGFVRGHITEILGWNYYFIIIYNRVPNRYSQTLSLCVHSRPRLQSSWGHHGAHLVPVGPRWALCWPHEPCFEGIHMEWCCHLSRLCGIVFACLLYCKYMWFIDQLSLLLYIVFGSVCTSTE